MISGRAAYAFAAFGTPCKPQYYFALFASISTLFKTGPRFPIIVMLSGACLEDAVLNSACAPPPFAVGMSDSASDVWRVSMAVRTLGGVQTVAVPIINTIRCRNLNASTERWAESYTIANVRSLRSLAWPQLIGPRLDVARSRVRYGI